MKFVRFRDPSGYVRRGQLNDDTISTMDRTYPLETISFLPPCEPSKIVCIGLNYADHVKETDADIPDRPKLFLKPPSTVRAHESTIELPDPEKRFDPEAELGVVIGEQARGIPRDEATSVIRGFTCFNDLSNRTDQRKEQNWVWGKAFDGAAPIGPAIVPPDALDEAATITCTVNGEIRQSSSRDRMLFDVPALIEEVTSYVTLEPGDVLATGTPRGIEPLEHGDNVEVSIEGIGTLRNTIHFPSE